MTLPEIQKKSGSPMEAEAFAQLREQLSRLGTWQLSLFGFRVPFKGAYKGYYKGYYGGRVPV